MRSASRPRHRAGFTLVELMITMVVMGLVVAASYTMFGTSSEVFYHQEQIAESQNSLRFATDLLKHDLMRAGLNASPNTDTDPWVCPKPVTALRAITITPRTLSVAGLNGGVPLAYDQIDILGDFSGRAPLRLESTPSGSTLQVDMSSLSETMLAAEAEAIFSQLIAPDQLMRITNPDGFSQFAQVASIDPGERAIQLTTPFTRADTGNPCGVQGSAGQNHELHALSAVRYGLRVNPSDPIQTDLVRWDLNPISGETVGDPLIIAEHVIGLELLPLGVSGLPNDHAVALDTNDDMVNLSRASSTDSILSDADMALNPERIRFLVYRVRTRTPRTIPRRLVASDAMLALPNADFALIQVGDGEVADVRTLQGRVELPNLTLRDL